MPILEINRSEGQNLRGLKRHIVLLPVDRIATYNPQGSQIVIDTDFDLVDEFDPTLIIIEATHLSGELTGKQGHTAAGIVFDIDLAFSYPGDERNTHKRLMQAADLKYFVVFVSDFNTTESDNRWRVLGSKEEPLEFSFSTTSNPKRNSIGLKGRVSQLVPWYDPEADPREDLD